MMNRMIRLALILTMAFTAVLAAGCSKQEPAAELSEEEQDQMGEELAAQVDQEAAAATEQAEGEEAVSQADQMTEEVLSDFVGEMDLAGSWQDEISQRAVMDVTQKEDGSYEILVHWGASAVESANWEIHGTYDPVSGMLSYEDGRFFHLKFENDKEEISDEQTTQGTFMKEGDKLRWSDSMNEEDGVFVKTN